MATAVAAWLLVGSVGQVNRLVACRSSAPPQNNTYTLVLAHLSRGALPPAKPDKNVAEDYLDPKYQIEEEAATTPDAATAAMIDSHMFIPP